MVSVVFPHALCRPMATGTLGGGTPTCSGTSTSFATSLTSRGRSGACPKGNGLCWFLARPLPYLGKSDRRYQPQCRRPLVRLRASRAAPTLSASRLIRRPTDTRPWYAPGPYVTRARALETRLPLSHAAWGGLALTRMDARPPSQSWSHTISPTSAFSVSATRGPRDTHQRRHPRGTGTRTLSCPTRCRRRLPGTCLRAQRKATTRHSDRLHQREHWGQTAPPRCTLLRGTLPNWGRGRPAESRTLPCARSHQRSDQSSPRIHRRSLLALRNQQQKGPTLTGEQDCAWPRASKRSMLL